MSVGAIILAGGAGERFGKEKQFVEYKGKALWEWVYKTCFDTNLFDMIVTVGVDFPGGKTRQDSVFYGLHKILAERVVILEAARPLVTAEQIVAIAQDTHDSVSFVAPAAETVLYNGQHLDRNRCEVLQVPQGFNTHRLVRAHMETGLTDATDDTILMRHRWGLEPHLLSGGRNLHKVTYPHDIEVLEKVDEQMLQEQKRLEKVIGLLQGT